MMMMMMMMVMMMMMMMMTLKKIASLDMDKMHADTNRILVVCNGAPWGHKSTFKRIFFPGCWAKINVSDVNIDKIVISEEFPFTKRVLSILSVVVKYATTWRTFNPKLKK